jgi:putative FmdB family regulatory protein
MATYVYRCDNCKDEIEVMHPMNNKPEIVCEKCNSIMKKKFVPTSAIIIGPTFRLGKISQPSEVSEKLEEFKERPEKDPYRKHRNN